MKLGKNWRRMADIYQRFAPPGTDLSPAAAAAMYQHESFGEPLANPSTNGFNIGKKWMDITIAMWREDIPARVLTVQELQDDGYPDWFLKRTGILHLTPTTNEARP